MATVHSYARFSTLKQGDGKDSEKRQAANRDAWIAKHGHTLSDVQLIDRGKSGFKGKRQKELGAFFEAIKDGRVQAGDILFVEHLDRLGRQGVRASQDLISKIFKAGVDIAISSPIEHLFKADDPNDFTGAIQLASFAYVAYTYSKTLSDRSKAWSAGARKVLKETGEPIPANTPAWIKRDKKTNTFHLIPERSAVVEYIFRETIAGIGSKTLQRELNKKFAPWRKGKDWNNTYVGQILNDRRAMGEFTPHAMSDDGKRVPVMEPIPNYYPAVINEKTWLDAQTARQDRRQERGPSKVFINLFTGLVYHAMDKCPVHIYSFQQTRLLPLSVPYREREETKITLRRLKSYNATNNVPGSSTETVDLDVFEGCVLGWLRELDTSVLSEGSRSRALEIKSLTTSREKKENKLRQLKAKVLEDDANLDLLLEAMKTVEKEIADLKGKLAYLQTHTAFRADGNKEYIEELRELPNTNENRELLRAAIKKVIKQIVILPVKLGTLKRSPVVCEIEITFHNGSRRTLLQGAGFAPIAITDPTPTDPPLLERSRDDLEKHKKALKKFALMGAVG